MPKMANKSVKGVVVKTVVLVCLLALALCVPVAYARDMHMPDRTIIVVPDEIPDLLTMPGEARSVYTGEKFALVAIHLTGKDGMYIMLIAVEPGPKDSKRNMVNFIALAVIKPNQPKVFYQDNRYFAFGFPDGKLVRTKELPDVEGLIARKESVVPVPKISI